MTLRELIVKYHDTNDLKEKTDLKNELLKCKTELKLPEAFEIAVLGHFDAFKISGKKSFLSTMLDLIP